MALATPERFELPTVSLGRTCSIQLSYGAMGSRATGNAARAATAQSPMRPPSSRVTTMTAERGQLSPPSGKFEGGGAPSLQRVWL